MNERTKSVIYKTIKIASAFFAVIGIAVVWLLLRVTANILDTYIGWERLAFLALIGSAFIVISYGCFITPWLLWTGRLRAGLEGASVQVAFLVMFLLELVRQCMGAAKSSLKTLVFLFVGVLVFIGLRRILHDVFGQGTRK